jgi:predicted metal-dependent RNase
MGRLHALTELEIEISECEQQVSSIQFLGAAGTVTGSKHLINTGDLQVHCGWIPRLYKAGYRGKVYATPATIDLCGVILPDSGHLQEEEADFLRRRTRIRLSLFQRASLMAQECSVLCLNFDLALANGVHKCGMVPLG